LYAFLVSPMRATCPASLTLLHLITLIILGEKYRLRSFSLRSFLHPPVISSLLGPNTLLNLCFSLNMRDQVSHPYKRTGKIRVFYI
jgi:hypothetical protein